MLYKHENKLSSFWNNHLTNISLCLSKVINSYASQLDKECIVDIPISNFKEHMSEIEHDDNLYVKDECLLKNNRTEGFIMYGNYLNEKI